MGSKAGRRNIKYNGSSNKHIELILTFSMLWYAYYGIKIMALLKSLQGTLSVEPGLTSSKKENSAFTEFETMKTC